VHYSVDSYFHNISTSIRCRRSRSTPFAPVVARLFGEIGDCRNGFHILRQKLVTHGRFTCYGACSHGLLFDAFITRSR